MIYEKELVRYKTTKFDHPKGLQNFAVTSLKKENKFERMLQQSKFCCYSIHGINYIWETDTRRVIRLFWALIVAVAIISCVAMYQILSSRHNEQQIRTVVETSQLPIYTINFPAVAVCPWNHVNWVRFRAAEEKFLPIRPDNSTRQMFHDLLEALEDISLNRLDTLILLAKYKTIPAVINKINLYDLIFFMAFRCDELFVSCAYDDTSYDCCKIFVAERTEKGICLVFNSMVSEESKNKKLKFAVMIYEKELVRYKTTKFDHPKGLQKFSVTSLKKEHKFERMLQQSKFCGFSIHGINYIWETDTRRGIRLFWALIVAAAIISCVVMYQILSSRHNEHEIKTVVETSQMPIYTINFPAVAVCPSNRLNWVRFKAAEERFLPQNSDNEIRQIFYDILVGLEDTSLKRLDPLIILSKYKTIPPMINNIRLFDLINFMAFRCDELFVSCAYDSTSYDCCKIFVSEHTEEGACLVFNSMISDESKNKKLTDEYYPWNVRKSGEGSGLVFTLRYNKTYQRPESKIPFGMHIMIKESDEWSEPSNHYVLPNTYNYFSVTPLLTETSPNTRPMSPQKRRCLFPNEKSDKYDKIDILPFNKLNCYAQCQHKSVIKNCNCTLPWFFAKIGDKFSECQVSDLQCIYSNRDVFSYIKNPLQDAHIKDNRRGSICDCIDSCISMIFLISLNTNLIRNPNTSVPIIKADIYIGQSVMTKYNARLKYTLLDLLANFGGILGLCLGASVLSLAEVLYATIKIIAVLIVTKRIKWRKIHPMVVVNYFKK